MEDIAVPFYLSNVAAVEQWSLFKQRHWIPQQIMIYVSEYIDPNGILSFDIRRNY